MPRPDGGCLGAGEARHQDGRTAHTLTDQGAADGGHAGADGGDVGGGAQEHEGEEHQADTETTDQPGGDVAVTDPARERGGHHGGHGHREECQSNQLYRHGGQGLQEGGQGGLNGADGVGSHGGGQ